MYKIPSLREESNYFHARAVSKRGITYDQLRNNYEVDDPCFITH